MRALIIIIFQPLTFSGMFVRGWCMSVQRATYTGELSGKGSSK